MHPRNTLEIRQWAESLKPGDKVLAQEFYTIDHQFQGDLVEYTVLNNPQSADINDPHFMVRAVIERYDSEGKRHCHFHCHMHIFPLGSSR